jgi:hypothetical protein
MARTAIHPGEHLADELRELGMSAAELARQIDFTNCGGRRRKSARRSSGCPSGAKAGRPRSRRSDPDLNRHFRTEIRTL